MTKNITSQNLDTISQNTTIDIGSFVKVTHLKIEEYGIRYFINPLPKSVIIAPLIENETKDLPHSLLHIPANQNYVFIKPTYNIPSVYQELENQEEDISHLILKKGDSIGKIIQIL